MHSEKRGVTKVEVSGQELRTLVDIACGSTHLNPYEDPAAFTEQLRGLLFTGAGNFGSDVAEFLRQETPVLLLRGLPRTCGAELVTPTVHLHSPPKKDWLSESILVWTGLLIGEPFCFVSEHEGTLIHNIYPIRGEQGEEISYGAGPLSLHADAAWDSSAPDFTLLFCLREQPQQIVTTDFSSMRSAVEELTEEERFILTQMRFSITAEPSFGKHARVPLAIWSRVAGQDLFRFDTALVHGTDPEAELVCGKLSRILEANRQRVPLAPGDLMVLKNLESVHGRVSFRPHYGGTDRWVQRLYVLRKGSPRTPAIPRSRRLQARAVQASEFDELDHRMGRGPEDDLPRSTPA